MFSLADEMIEWRKHQANKHGLGEYFHEDDINKLSNYEFLIELSNALERIKERKTTI